MSWDIFIQDIPESANSTADIPDDFQPRPIGTRSDIIQRIKSIAPMADFSDPSCGTIDGDNFSIEVNIGENEKVNSISLHVRGGDAAAGVVADIILQLKVRAFDGNSTTGIFDPNSAVESFKQWRAYRDTIVKDGGS